MDTLLPYLLWAACLQTAMGCAEKRKSREKEKQRRDKRRRYLKLTDYCGLNKRAANRRQNDKMKEQELSRATN